MKRLCLTGYTQMFNPSLIKIYLKIQVFPFGAFSIFVLLKTKTKKSSSKSAFLSSKVSINIFGTSRVNKGSGEGIIGRNKFVENVGEEEKRRKTSPNAGDCISTLVNERAFSC